MRHNSEVLFPKDKKMDKIKNKKMDKVKRWIRDG